MLFRSPKWLGVIPYLKILSISAIPMPLSYLNMNILKAKNRADLYLKLEIIKKLLFLPIVYFGVRHSMNLILILIVIIALLDYLINTTVTSKIVHYTLKMQFQDIIPTLFYGLALLLAVWVVDMFGVNSIIFRLVLKGVAYITIIIGSGELFRMKEYIEIKRIVFDQIGQRFSA